MISDYEEALLNNMQQAFPDGRARGCWFHYGQVILIGLYRISFLIWITPLIIYLKAIYRKAVDLGLKVAYHEKYNVRFVIKMLIALALLPADRMYEGFQV